MRAVWRLAAPSLNSYEDPEQPQQVLSVNYMDNCDGRAGDRLTLGPLVTDIDCSGADAAAGGAAGTAATARAMVFSESMETTNYLVVARGTKLGIIRLDTRVLTADGTAEGAGAAYSEAVYDLLYTRQGVTDEISVFFEGIGYRVITAIAGASYTASANNESKIVAIGRRMGSDAAAGIVGMLGRSGDATTALNTVYQNILNGSVTQDASSVTTIATITGPDLRFTGMAMDGRYWIIGTSDGPYYLEADGRRFRPLIEEIDNQLTSATNGFGMRRSTYFGTVIPLERSTRVSNELQGASIGPEIYPRNDSPVRNRVGMGDGSELWDYWPIYNGTDTYICAVRPRRAEDYVVDEAPVVYYPIIKLASAESKVVAYAGRRGGVTSRTVYFGNGSNVSWFLEGSALRFPDDGCFPANTPISLETLPVSVTRRWYSGELTEITTALGHKLTGTPNHPVLTDRGWIALSSLKEGDRVAYDGLPIQTEAGGDPDVENVNPTLSEVFDLASIGNTGNRRATVRENFHGDGQDGYVDIKPINGELRNWLESRRLKPIQDGDLVLGNMRLAELESSRLSPEPVRVGASPSGRSPSRTQPGNLLLSGLGGQPQASGIRQASDGDTLVSQVPVDDVRVNTELPGDARRGFAGQVAFCDVSSTRRIPFSGHVYNLETESHRYGANGIVVHNSYTYASTGTVFGTELRRNPEKLKKIKRIGLSTNNCTSTETVAIDIVYRDQQYVERTVRCGAPITKNGWKWVDVPAGQIVARTLYPKVTLARGGTTTLSPYVVNRGEVVIEYDEVDG